MTRRPSRSALYGPSRGLYGHVRSLPDPAAPRNQPPNGIPPGVNPPPVTAAGTGDYAPVSVGPDASDGYGNDVVTTFGGGIPPAPVSPWSGWPDGWQTPAWNDGAFGAWSRLADIVFACLDLNTSILSTMPPYLLNNGDRQGGRTWLVNPEPMQYPSWVQFCREFFWSYISVGEVFVYATARGSDDYPSRFMVVNPALVNVERAGGRVEYAIAGMPVDADDICHIKYASWPGDLRGHGPLEAAGARLLTVTALTRYATGMATTGAIPPAVIRYPRRASRAQMRQMQADWINARASAMGVPAVLADGAEFDVLNPQLKDAALADLSRFSEARVATLLSVPPFLVGLNSEGSGAYINATNVFDFHWRAGLRPKAAAACSALSTWLLPRGWTLALDADDYIKPGMFERAQAYSMLIASGVLTAAEVRGMEHFDTTPGDADPDLPGPDTGAATQIPGTPGRPVQTNTNATPQEATTP